MNSNNSFQSASGASVRAVLKNVASYLPARCVMNDALPAHLETNDAWIRERTGIEMRYIAAEDEYTSHMATHAARKVLDRAGWEAESVDAILVATATPDYTYPGVAPIVAGALGCTHASAMDIQAACSGFVYGLQLVDALIRSEQAKRVLLIGAETMSRVVDWQDRRTCILFGDGAGAALFEADALVDAQGYPRGIIATHLGADGARSHILRTSGGVSSTQTAGALYMEGQEVFRHAVARMAESVQIALEKASLQLSDVDWAIPHQANARILQACARKLGLDDTKVISTVQWHANTSAASIPLALAHALDKKTIKTGEILALPALGAGLTWGCCVIRY